MNPREPRRKVPKEVCVSIIESFLYNQKPFSKDPFYRTGDFRPSEEDRIMWKKHRRAPICMFGYLVQTGKLSSRILEKINKTPVDQINLDWTYDMFYRFSC